MDSQKIVGILQPQISSSTQISHPSSKIDGVGLERWTEWKAPTFSMTAKPANVEDLQSIVKCATAHNIPFLATSSGHGYSHAYGKAKDVLEIDLTNFKDIHVDNDSSTVTIGGAVRHREVFEPLWAAKKQIRTSSISILIRALSLTEAQLLAPVLQPVSLA
jgi:FAD/FMN-containing dehydrogenase